MNALSELQEHKQSIWLDYIRRDLIVDGGLKQLVVKDGVSGVTSNPTIFEKAIDSGGQYDGALTEMFARHPMAEPAEVYDELVIEDVRNAADVLLPVYQASGGADGFVSIEPPSQLTGDTERTIQEARRLRRAVSRPNIMIKVVATEDGVAAVEPLIAEGVNVNITLIFSLRHYEAVAAAYMRGLQKCSSPDHVASVASFFVSRVDAQVDKALDASGSPCARELRGKIAIANAKAMYQRFQEIFRSEEFSALRYRGARIQRPLWASTGTKDPSYRDVLYVEELIGPDTVNTLPPSTLDAFRDHGQVRGDTVLENWPGAERDLHTLSSLGIDLDAIADALQADGVKSFASAYSRVLSAIAANRQELSRTGSRP